MANEIIRLATVLDRTGLGRSTIYNLMAEPGATFPKPIALGARAVGWLESEVDDWIANKIKKSRGSPPSLDRFHRRESEVTA